jgi:poly(hydroxyalkanoate) granule-associated protein
MAEKKKVTIVTKKKKKSGSTATGSAAGKAGTKTGAKAGTKKSAAKKSAAKKSGPLGLPSLPELLDFPAGLADSAREVWMAGIGALSTVEEIGAGFFDQLVRKGETWEEESRKKLVAASKQAGAAAEGARSTAGSLSQKPLAWSSAVEKRVEQLVEDSIEGVLHRMNVPTHDEVQELTKHVSKLSDKVDALSARLKLERAERSSAPPTEADTPVYHVVPHDEGWAVEKEGATRATSVHGTKSEAVSAGRERAKSGASGRLVIHRQDGTIQDSFAYGE